MNKGPRARISLPDARYFAVTWGIPENYGGMTSVLLQRSRAFAQLAGKAVEILTFDGNPDYPTVEQNLRERGELVPAMKLVNLWDWLREHETPSSAPGSLALNKHPFTPLESSLGFASAARDGRELTRTRFSDDRSTVLQVDYFRLDGTLLASDRRDVHQPGILGGRSVVLCDSTGQPVRSWGSIWGLYRFWLDRLRGGILSIMIIDSKTSARFMLGYRRADALTIHVIHGTHVSDGDTGVIRASRTAVIDNLDGFDSVVVLTQRQKSDIEQLLGSVPNLTVIPNSTEPEVDSDTRAPRQVGHGAVIASLSRLKRVDHAVRSTVAAIGASTTPVSLDIYGEGDQRAALEQFIEHSGVTAFVRLHGHVNNARAQLASASFLLLTSRSEAFALVLLESMAAGCIPIAYDIPYGPADIITHGRNGLLVPAGDEAALTEAILSLQRMRPAGIARMRRNAQRTARQYSDQAVIKLWARELRSSLRRKLE